MSLIRVSLVPLELYEYRLREKFEQSLSSGAHLIPLHSGSLDHTFQELCDFSPKVFKANKHLGTTLLALHGSSACLIAIEALDDWEPTLSAVASELQTRRALHRDTLQDQDEVFGIRLTEALSPARAAGYRVKARYVFSFYIYRPDYKPDETELSILKLLAEPSLLDLDDMLSSRVGTGVPLTDGPLEPKVRRALDDIPDVDLAPDVTTWITWASIVCVDCSVARRQAKTFDLLVALETRLQIVWNRCQSFSNLADAILTGRTRRFKGVNDFFWGLARTFDDAQGVLAATSSSRANKLFAAMIATSALEKEIGRLAGKVELLNRYLVSRNLKRDARYRKTIEVLLFFAALSQVVPLFFRLPLLQSELTGQVALGVVTILGLAAILIRRSE